MEIGGLLVGGRLKPLGTSLQFRHCPTHTENLGNQNILDSEHNSVEGITKIYTG